MTWTYEFSMWIEILRIVQRGKYPEEIVLPAAMWLQSYFTFCMCLCSLKKVFHNFSK